MKKILLIVLSALLIMGCKQEVSNKDTNPSSEDSILYSGTVEGGSWEIRYKKDVVEGITTEVVNYILTNTSTGERRGVAVNREGTSTLNSVYKFGIMAGKKSEPFPNGFFNEYEISLGQSNLSLSNAVSAPAQDGTEYQFIIIGGITHSNLQSLKAATLITVELRHNSEESRTATIPVHPNFQKALLSKFQ